MPCGRRIRWLGFTCLLLGAMLTERRATTAAAGVDAVPAAAVKAAFLFNFAKFVEWPALAPAAPLIICIVGDAAIAGTFVGTVRGHRVGGHAFDVRQPKDPTGWRNCHLLFVADGEPGKAPGAFGEVAALPVLTVSDGQNFSRRGGIIELYVEGGRMRFAINVDAAARSGLRLSSRLLSLAKIIRNDQVQ